jgi:chromosome partitioning protein
VISVALFNNRGGVGATTLTYHLAHMFQRLRVRVLAVDLDPQSNLTAAFLDEDDLAELWREPSGLARAMADPSGGPFPPDGLGRAGTIAQSVQPIMDGVGDIVTFEPVAIVDGLWLLPGDLGLSPFEAKLSDAWPHGFSGEGFGAIRTTTAFHRLIVDGAAKVGADLVLVDIGPNLGAINRSALLAADHVLMPLTADLFSLRGLRNLGPTLRDWRSTWRDTVLPRVPSGIPVPEGAMRPMGYVIMQPTMRIDRPVKAYRWWLERIPGAFENAVLSQPPASSQGGMYEVATLKNYQSLMSLARDARKPMFDLRAADGAIGSMQAYVQRCYAEFLSLAVEIASRVGDLPALRSRLAN